MKFSILLTTVLILAAHSASAGISKLDKKDPLAKEVSHFSMEWKANNISTGTTRIYSEIWPRSLFANGKASENTQLDLLKKEVIGKTGDLDTQVNLRGLRVSVHSFHERDVIRLTKAYMLGNAFDLKNKDSFKMGSVSIYSILPKLSRDLHDVVTVEAMATHSFDGEKRRVFLTTFINKVNGKAVSFFITEGKM